MRTGNNAWCVDCVTFMGLQSPHRWQEVKDLIPNPDLPRPLNFGEDKPVGDSALWEIMVHKCDLDPIFYEKWPVAPIHKRFPHPKTMWQRIELNRLKYEENKRAQADAEAKETVKLRRYYEECRKRDLRNAKAKRKANRIKPSVSESSFPATNPPLVITGGRRAYASGLTEYYTLELVQQICRDQVPSFFPERPYATRQERCCVCNASSPWTSPPWTWFGKHIDLFDAHLIVPCFCSDVCRSAIVDRDKFYHDWRGILREKFLRSQTKLPES